MVGPKLKATTPRPRSRSNLGAANPDNMETQPLVPGIPDIAPSCLEEMITKLEVDSNPPFPHQYQYKKEFRELAQRVAKGTAYSF